MKRSIYDTATLRAIAPIAGAVFAAAFTIGMALPALPLHLHDRLGAGAFIIGVVASGHFMAALVSRLWAGHISDTHGPKRAVLLALVAGMCAGACYLSSLLFIDIPDLSIAILLLGRAFNGASESLIIIGAMMWGIGRVAPDRSAQVMGWIGTSFFAALAVGAPAGSAVFERFGFLGVALANLALPLLSLAAVMPVPALAPISAAKMRFWTVLRAVLIPGAATSLSAMAFGSIAAFLALHFAVQGWSHTGLAFTAFAVATILTRVVAGHLPDRFGGARVAFYCLWVQALGLALIGTANSSILAIAGAFLAGAGASLVFPSLALEAMRRVPAASRGAAMGIYNASLDLTLGLLIPALGFMATGTGLGAVFNVSAAAAIVAVPIAIYLIRHQAAEAGGPR